MAACKPIEKKFLSPVKGAGRGPLAYEKALRQYKAAVRRASRASSANYRRALRWARTKRCPAPCRRAGHMVISPYITVPTFRMRRNPTRVWLTGKAGALAIVFCKPPIEA